MSYYGIEDFKAGIDLRKSVFTAPAGTLRTLNNAHITQGGEIEKRPGFVQWSEAPAGSFGLMELSRQVYVVQQNAASTPPNGLNPGVIGVQMPEGLNVLALRDWDLYDGKIYVVVEGSDGNYHHFYDGVYVPGGKGKNIRTYKEKIYGVLGRTLYFSAVGDPTTWTDPPPDPTSGAVQKNGSGFINIGANDADSEDLVAMEVYYDKLALFSKLAAQIWFLDPDPAANQFYQTLRDSGALAPNSVIQFVANDVYFLGNHGIRSLRARDVTTTAAVTDVGSPVDKIFQDLLALEGEDYMAKAQALLNPRTGRFYVVLPGHIYVLSAYPSPNVNAWARYEPPAEIENAVFADPYMYLRDVNGVIWRFGGTVDVFDSCPVDVELPFLSFDKPATMKTFEGIDVSCTGTWQVYAGLNPGNPDAEDLIATIDGPTFLGGRIPFEGRSTHVKLRFHNEGPGPATLAKVFVHYTPAETD